MIAKEMTVDDWVVLFRTVCQQGEQRRERCHADMPGICDGKTDWCGACNRLPRKQPSVQSPQLGEKHD